MYKNVQFMAEVCFDGAYGVCGVCVASALNMCIENATNFTALNAYCTSTIKPQYMTKFAMG